MLIIFRCSSTLLIQSLSFDSFLPVGVCGIPTGREQAQWRTPWMCAATCEAEARPLPASTCSLLGSVVKAPWGSRVSRPERSSSTTGHYITVTWRRLTAEIRICAANDMSAALLYDCKVVYKLVQAIRLPLNWLEDSVHKYTNCILNLTKVPRVLWRLKIHTDSVLSVE